MFGSLPNLMEVWYYRDLLVQLARRDIQSRFRQSIFGVGWAVLTPLLTTLIYTVIFSVFIRVDTSPVPYPVFVFTALIPWLYFSASLTKVSASVVAGGPLLSKVFFPRLVLPLSALVVAGVELCIHMVVLLGVMALYGYWPGGAMVALPLFLAYTLLTTFAFGIWLAALNVRYRDVGMVVPFLLQTWMYLCPIIYSVEMVPERFRALYCLNPMVGAISGFRWCLAGAAEPNWMMIGISCLGMLIVLTGGLIYFRHAEDHFADII